MIEQISRFVTCQRATRQEPCGSDKSLAVAGASFCDWFKVSLNNLCIKGLRVQDVNIFLNIPTVF